MWKLLVRVLHAGRPIQRFLRPFDVDGPRRMHLDIAALDADIGTTAGKQDFLLRRHLDQLFRRGELHVLQRSQFHRITLCLQFDLALGSKQLGPGVLRKQADALHHAGQQRLAAGNTDVLTGTHGQVLAAVQVGVLRGGGSDVGRGGGDQQRLLVPRGLAASAATNRPGGITAVALLLARALAGAAVVAAVGDVGIGVELGQAVEAGLQGVGVVLFSGVGEGLETLLAVLQ